MILGLKATTLLLPTLIASLLLAAHNHQLQAQSSKGETYNYEPSSQAFKGKLLAGTYNPVLFIPGDGGSQLEAKLNKTTRVHYICDLTSDWYDIWLNLHLLVPEVIDCLCDNLRLTYNSSTRLTQNAEGVQIRPTNFGSLDSVDYLDILKVPKTDYFEKIISTLESKNGFTRNRNMIGAGFDFRKAPNELGEFFSNLTNLIQDLYIRNNYRKVTIICHSMGCLNSLYFLNRKSQGWKDAFIRRLITLGSPWDGSFKAISAMLFGDDLGIPFLNKQILQKLQSTFPSLMYLFPKPPTFQPERVLVQTSSVNFTLQNLDELFKATSLFDQMEMWHDTRTIAANLSVPNVELWCLYGYGIATPSQIVFKGRLSDGKYEEVQGDGDGTVNVESLRACERFSALQVRPVFTKGFDKVDHIDILRGDEAASFISEVILPGDLQVN